MRPLLVRFSLALLLCHVASHAQVGLIQIHADLTEAPRKLFHADVDLPVRPGPLTLTTPEWIPGAHGPHGPVANIAGLHFTTAAGMEVPWRRDPLHVFAYHLTVPKGVSRLHAHLDAINTRATRNTAVLEWESLLLYPADTPVREIPIQAAVTVPAHWGVGTSLKPVPSEHSQRTAGDTTTYAPTTVEMLEDAPVMTGANFREYPLAPEITPGHFVDFVGALASDVEIRPEVIEQLSRLVREGMALYGPPHYNSYHFLVLIPRTGGGGGLEHHESSDNSLPHGSLSDSTSMLEVADVLPHEFTHSWNGKYRRPAGLATPDYATPMKGDLLWVYEGLTNYLGNMLSARIGSRSAERYREYLAVTAAQMDATGGRSWRSIEDTTALPAMPRVSSNNSAWSNWRRGADYYPEGDLLWLDVDTTLRQLSGGKRSLRDFLQIFLQKGGPGGPRVVPYDLQEIEADLNQLVAHDWAAFFEERVYRVNPRANLEGITQGGYRLEYDDEPTAFEKAAHEDLAFWFSLGVDVGDDGRISDVRVGSPADAARLAPGQRLTVVNGTAFSRAALHQAVAASRQATGPIELMVQDEDTVMPVQVNYHGGDRHPRLVRVEGTPDLLLQIATPLTSGAAAAH